MMLLYTMIYYGDSFFDYWMENMKAMAFFLGIVLLLFRYSLFYGYRFIGNSDRLNHYLSWAKFHADNLRGLSWSAWCDYLFMGFDSLGEPFSFFQPLFMLPLLVKNNDVILVFNYVVVFLLFLTLLMTYYVLYKWSQDELASITGSLIFGLSIFSLLKLSQNDNTYLSVMAVPLFFYLVDSTNRSNWVGRFLWLTFFLTGGIYVCFLQEFSYIVLFLLVYGGYLLLFHKRFCPLLVFSGALGVASFLSFPRLQLLYETIMSYTRGSGFSDYLGIVYLLRFFNGNIFGNSMRQALTANAGVNLSEGNLLYVSIFASFLLVLIVTRYPYRLNVNNQGESYWFWVVFIIGVFLVVHVGLVYEVFAELYFNISFLHTRFSVAALLPIALVSTVYLTRSLYWNITVREVFLLLAIAAPVWGLSWLEFGSFFVKLGGTSILVGELVRLLMMLAIFTILWVCQFKKWIDFNSWKTLMAFIIIGQSIIGAEHYINGVHTRSYEVPFEKHDLVMAKSNEFMPPSGDKVKVVQKLLDNDNYRSLIVCPDNIAIFCSNNMGLSWRIRLVDGYLSGLPKRLAQLPWIKSNVGMRTIRFNEVNPNAPLVSDIPWKLVSLLNVKNAIVMSPKLFTNQNLEVKDIKLIANPSPYIYPRVYFANEVRSVSYMEVIKEIKEKFGRCDEYLSDDCGEMLTFKYPVDYVEGKVGGRFDDEGKISWSFEGDLISITFPSSSRSRFLVINESYNRHWKAYVNDDQVIPIYPTNLVMRGLVIPPRVKEVVLRYDNLVSQITKMIIK